MLDYLAPDQRREAGGSPVQAAAPRLPVVVVTGYLGSGKTTLISALMRRPDMAGTAVIVNELAEAGIDQSIIGASAGGEVLLLANGCLCCAGGTDLRNAVARLISAAAANGQPLSRILIETSGAADPAPIMRQLCFDPLLRNRLRYGGVLTLFDALHGRALLERDPVGLRQIGLADRILLTKTDLVDPQAAAAVGRFLSDLNPSAPITALLAEAQDFVATAGQGAAKAGGLAWLGPAAETTAARPHERPLSTWSIRSAAPVNWRLAEQAIRIAFDRHGDDVLRTKGLIWTDDEPRPLAIHGIGRHFHRPVRLAGWDGAPATRMVVIGFAGALPAAQAIAGAISGTLSPSG